MGKLPRPYLSDLAIDPNYRRQGFAKLLIKESEQFVLDSAKSNADQDGKQTELWIRVAENNHAAIKLYRDRLGYSKMDWSTTTGNSVKTESTSSTITDETEVWTLR